MSRRPELVIAAALSVVATSLSGVVLAPSTADAPTHTTRLGSERLSLAREGDGLRILEGRVVTQDLSSRQVCNVEKVVDRYFEPNNVRGCMGLDDVKVTAYDQNRNVLASALTYASEREDGPAHGYYYLHVPAGKKYYVEFSKPGYVRDRERQVTVKGGDARGGRSWGGLALMDLRTELRIDKGADREFYQCERVEIPQTLSFRGDVPDGYPAAPYGKNAYELDFGYRQKFPDVIKEKWGGRFVSILGGRFSIGQHRVKMIYLGQDYPGTFPDVAESSATFFFRVRRGCAAGRPAAGDAETRAAAPVQHAH